MGTDESSRAVNKELVATALEEVEGEANSGVAATGGVVCNVDEGSGVDRTMSWKDVDSTWERGLR